jgi:hypothetical protein
LSRFVNRYTKIIADLASKKVTVEMLSDEILHSAKLKYDDGAWYDMVSKEGVRK